MSGPAVETGARCLRVAATSRAGTTIAVALPRAPIASSAGWPT
jgi:hypothetical protein